MRISKIILDNFRGYKHAEIAFNRFNCIVGKNDAGKSTIFEAIKWFFDNTQKDADDNFNINQLLYDNSSLRDQFEAEGLPTSSLGTGFEENYSYLIRGQIMSVEIRFIDVDDTDIKHWMSEYGELLDIGYSLFQQSYDQKDFLNNGELCIKKQVKHSKAKYTFENQNSFGPNYYLLTKQFDNKKPISLWNLETIIKEYKSIYGENDDLIREINNKIKKGNSTNLKPIISGIRNDYQDQTHYDWMLLDYKITTIILRTFPKFRYINDNTLESELNNLVFTYFNTRYQHQINLNLIKEGISEEVEEINDIFKNIITHKSELSITPKISCKLNVQIEFSNGIDNISLTKRGVGFQRVFLTMLFQYLSNKETGYESIFVFEEPETHLHPEAQKTFLNSLKAISKRYNQVIITTHSPLVVSMCNVEDIIQIKNVNNEPKIFQKKTVNLQEVIEDLGIGPNDSMLSLFDSYKSILFVEGKNDNYTLNKISELYKEKEYVDKTFEEMKCLIMFIGGCSTVEEWANLGIVTKLAKPFVILLDSDKKNSGHISNNQKKLDNIYQTLNDSIETSKQAKINFCKDNFITTRKRELENYIKPSVIENYYNKKSHKNLRDEEIEDIQDIMEMIKNVELSIIAFVYKHDKSIKKYTTEALENIPVENKKEKRRQIRKEKTIELLNNYIKEYQKSNSKFQYKEWLYCKVKGIDINHYTEYKDVIGKRSYIYCMEKEINVKKYREIYNQCKWIDNNYHYLIAYVKHIDQMGGVDLTKLDSIEKFENVLDSKMKEEITHIEQAIKNTTITDVITDFSFSNEIKDNWEYIDVPLAIYCCKGHLDYNEDLPDKKSKCESIKVEINKYFFEEGNINYEDLDFTYGNDQDEFLDIYNKIKKLSE